MATSRQFIPWEHSDDEDGLPAPTTIGLRLSLSSGGGPAPLSSPAAFRVCGRSRSPPRQSPPSPGLPAPRQSPRHSPRPTDCAPPLIDLTEETNQPGLAQDGYCGQASVAPPTLDLTAVENQAERTHDPDWRQDQDWRQYEISIRRDLKWWLQRPGIIDASLRSSSRARQSAKSEGKTFRFALSDIRWALSTRTCEFKVGFATYLGYRWQLYQQDDGKWTPRYLFMLCTVPDRVSAGFLEAGLIAAIESLDLDHRRLNINWRNNDKGGTGPRKSETSCIAHYIYLAVNPLGE